MLRSLSCFISTPHSLMIYYFLYLSSSHYHLIQRVMPHLTLVCILTVTLLPVTLIVSPQAPDIQLLVATLTILRSLQLNVRDGEAVTFFVDLNLIRQTAEICSSWRMLMQANPAMVLSSLNM